MTTPIEIAPYWYIQEQLARKVCYRINQLKLTNYQAAKVLSCMSKTLENLRQEVKCNDQISVSVEKLGSWIEKLEKLDD